MKPYINFIIPPYHKRLGSSTIFPLGIGYLISSLSKQDFNFEILDFTQNMDDVSESISEISIHSAIENLVKLQSKDELLYWGIGPVTTASAIFLEWIVAAIRKFSIRPIICGGPLPSILGQRWFFLIT